MITDYKRARKDAAFLVDWAKNLRRGASAERYLEALSVMNGHDGVDLLAVVLMTAGTVLPKLPDGYENDGVSDGVSEPGA